jgi:hypothetical protein
LSFASQSPWRSDSAAEHILFDRKRSGNNAMRVNRVTYRPCSAILKSAGGNELVSIHFPRFVLPQEAFMPPQTR